MSQARLISLYYLATPAFAVLDLFVGVSIRAAGLESAGWRLAYYGFAFACWIAIRYRPGWTPVVGVGESSVNLFLLILSVLGPIFAAPIIVAEGGDPAITFGVGRMFNILLAGTVLIASFHGHQGELARRLGLRSSPMRGGRSANGRSEPERRES